MKTFRSSRDRRPPEPFVISYEYEIKPARRVALPALPGDDFGTIGSGEVEPAIYEPREQKFHARYGAIPSGIMLAAGEPGAGQAVAIRQVLECSVVERDDLLALLSDPKAVIELSVLIEIFEWIAEMAADRPTSKPSS